MSASLPEPPWARSPSDGGDRFSDLDLTFGIADDVPVADVLDDWTRTLERRARRGAPCRPRARSDHLPRVPAAGRAPVRPLDDAGGAVSSRRATIPASVRRDGGGGRRGPRRRWGGLFIATPPVAEDLFGWGVIYALQRARASSAGVSGRPSTTSVPCATTRSRLPASARGCPRCRRAATTTFPLRPLPDSRMRTSARSSLGRSGQPSPHPSCAHARGPEARLPHADIVAQRLAELR